MNIVALTEGLILVAGGLILFAYLRRRRNAKAEAEKSIAPRFGYNARRQHKVTTARKAHRPRPSPSVPAGRA